MRSLWREIFKNIGKIGNAAKIDLFSSWFPANWLSHILAFCVEPRVALIFVPDIALVLLVIKDGKLVAVSNICLYFTFADIAFYTLVCTLSCSSSGNVACLYLMNYLFVTKLGANVPKFNNFVLCPTLYDILAPMVC